MAREFKVGDRVRLPKSFPKWCGMKKDRTYKIKKVRRDEREGGVATYLIAGNRGGIYLYASDLVPAGGKR